MTAKENFLRTIFRDSPEWIPFGMESEIYIGPPIIERPIKAGFDDWGVEYVFDEKAAGGTYPKINGHPIKDFTKWRKHIQIPDIDKIDWDLFASQKKINKIDREAHVISGFIEFGIFERTYLLLGLENALINYLTEPEEMLEISKVIADYKINLIKKFYSIVKPDIIWYGDDWGTQRKLFLPPDIWRKIIKPQTKRIYDAIKELGLIVNQHSCGKIEEVFEDIVEMGADIWNPCQPCNDLANLKKEYGDKITFCGGIDSQFVLHRPDVTTDEVRTEVRKRIDEMGKGGGYIAMPSHSVPFRKDVVDAMNDEISRYGRYAK